jgi:hypothetical protein
VKCFRKSVDWVVTWMLEDVCNGQNNIYVGFELIVGFVEQLYLMTTNNYNSLIYTF